MSSMAILWASCTMPHVGYEVWLHTVASCEEQGCVRRTETKNQCFGSTDARIDKNVWPIFKIFFLIKSKTKGIY